MSTAKAVLLIAQRAWRRDQHGQCALPMAIRQRWWAETDYSRHPLRASDELVETLKHFRAVPRTPEVHPPIGRKIETWVFAARRYDVTLRLRGDVPFLLRIVPSDALASPTMTRQMIGEGEQCLLCVDSTVPVELVRSVLARVLVPPPQLDDGGVP
jgi:hypothetical protein